MALLCLQGSAPEEVPDMLVKGDEVLEEILDMKITSLNPIIMDKNEFLSLDDITKTFGLCKDEALSVNVVNNSAQGGNIEINFEDDHFTKTLAYNIGGNSLEDVASKALLEIKQDVQFY